MGPQPEPARLRPALWIPLLLAAVAGVFYGMAFRTGKGIRAAMVTHALTVTTWKTFFS